MSFWWRYSLLLVACIIGPLALSFFFDTESQLERAKRTGEASAAVAMPALTAQLTLDAQALVNAALGTAQQLSEEKLVPGARERRPDAVRADLAARLRDLVGPSEDGRWVWVLDEDGAVVARTDGEVGERFTGQPLFQSTQLGFALDGLLTREETVSMVGAAPIARDGEAKGAVFVGRPVSAAQVGRLASTIGVGVSVLTPAGRVLASSLPEGAAAAIAARLQDTFAGQLEAPLPGGSTLGSLLPLLVPRTLDGLAFASVSRVAPGGQLTWVVSHGTAVELAQLGVRQEIELGVLVAALLLALVIGMVLHRTFVRPIEVLTTHLAELTQGRGERELPDSAVSAPFRRLVKLVNMKAQRAPTGSFGFGEARFGEDGAGTPLNSFPPGSSRPESVPGAGLAPGSLPPGSTLTRAASSGRVEPATPVAPAPMRLAPAAAPAPFVPLAPVAAAPEPGPDVLNQPIDDALRAMGVVPGQGTKRPARGASDIRGTPSASLLDFDAKAILSQPPAPAPAVQTLTGRPPSVVGASNAAFGAAGGAAEALPVPSAVPAQVSARPRAASVTADIFVQADARGFVEEARRPAGSRMGGSAASALTGGAGVSAVAETDTSDEFKSEATVVAAPDQDLLAASARDMTTGAFRLPPGGGDRTVVAQIPQDLLAESRATDEDKPEEVTHFRETYDAFVAMRRQCGESTADLAYDRFVQKLRKNRDGLLAKYQCRTVRFQVYERDGKAALKATPVR